MLVNPARRSPAVAAVLGDDLPAFTEVLRVMGARRARNVLRRRYYDGEERVRNIGIAVPEDLEVLMPVVGWPAKTVNVVASRLHVEGFTVPGEASSSTELARIFDENCMGVGARQAHTAALRDGCAGSSPHTRGLRDQGAGQPLVTGIIPAHAGFTPPEHSRRSVSVGSSPHTRGLRDQPAAVRRPCGIIPAHAGFTW